MAKYYAQITQHNNCIRARITNHRNRKSILSPRGLSVPWRKIISISFLRLVAVSQLSVQSTATFISLTQWPAELKCVATGSSVPELSIGTLSGILEHDETFETAGARS